MSVVARIEEDAIRPDLELSDLLKRAGGDGAVVSFTGVARPVSKKGGAVDRLLLQHHPVLTLQSLQSIAGGAAARFAVSHVHVVHRCGDIKAGEPIMFAGAASPHRRAAFDATDYLMDRLKTEAVFWKRELSEEASEWIEPTEADYADRDRWD